MRAVSLLANCVNPPPTRVDGFRREEGENEDRCWVAWLVAHCESALPTRVDGFDERKATGSAAVDPLIYRKPDISGTVLE